MMATAVFPKRKSGVTVSSDGVTLSGTDGTQHRLNETAAALWELCDGRILPSEMVDAICTLFAEAEVTVAADVDHALVEFSRLGLIDWVPRQDDGKVRPLRAST